jgi:hypothetical protein
LTQDPTIYFARYCRNSICFAKGTQILDEILMANEVVDDVKKRKKELILFKVDFKKAYDLDEMIDTK